MIDSYVFVKSDSFFPYSYSPEVSKRPQDILNRYILHMWQGQLVYISSVTHSDTHSLNMCIILLGKIM